MKTFKKSKFLGYEYVIFVHILWRISSVILYIRSTQWIQKTKTERPHRIIGFENLIKHTRISIHCLGDLLKFFHQLSALKKFSKKTTDILFQPLHTGHIHQYYLHFTTKQHYSWSQKLQFGVIVLLSPNPMM